MKLLEQFRNRCAEQFVLGKAVEGCDEFLVVMGPCHRAFILQNLAQLGAQNGYVLRLFRGGLRREQSYEMIEAADGARRPVAPHRDTVHRPTPMDQRIHPRLADDQRRSLEEQLALRSGKLRQGTGAPQVRILAFAEDPKLRTELDRQVAGAVRTACVVAPVTQENKSALNHPSEEVAHLHKFALRRSLLADAQRARRHLVEISGRGANILEDPANIGTNPLAAFLGRCKLDFGMNERFVVLGCRLALEGHDLAVRPARYAVNRMQHHDNASAEMAKMLEHAVDDKRAIGHQRIDHRDALREARPHAHRYRLPANGKELERGRYEFRPPLFRNSLYPFVRLAREQTLRKQPELLGVDGRRAGAGRS